MWKYLTKGHLFLLMKKKLKLNINGEFGKRLFTLRKARGITQKELAEKIGTSQRMIAYYEGSSNYIPANFLPYMAKVLKVSVDELLGIKHLKDEFVPKNIRLWKKLRTIENLPPKDQKSVLHYVEALVNKQKP